MLNRFTSKINPIILKIQCGLKNLINNIDNKLFSPMHYDTRIVYINSHIVEKFIKDELQRNVKSMKKELFEAGIIHKADNRYTFKKHDKGEHIYLCLFAEFWELSDNKEHLSNKQSND